MGNTAAGKITQVLLIAAALAGVTGIPHAGGARTNRTVITADAPDTDGFGWDGVRVSSARDGRAA